MGYNINCFRENCDYNCCDYWGDCVADPNECYYYYSDLHPGAIAGIVIGSVIGVAILIAIACYCYRKKNLDLIR